MTFVNRPTTLLKPPKLYHVTQNHPFIDGNKRTGLACALVFLELNGVSVEYGTEDLYNLTMGVASSSIEKAQIADELRRLAELSDCVNTPNFT